MNQSIWDQMKFQETFANFAASVHFFLARIVGRLPIHSTPQQFEYPVPRNEMESHSQINMDSSSSRATTSWVCQILYKSWCTVVKESNSMNLTKQMSNEKVGFFYQNQIVTQCGGNLTYFREQTRLGGKWLIVFLNTDIFVPSDQSLSSEISYFLICGSKLLSWTLKGKGILTIT